MRAGGVGLARPSAVSTPGPDPFNVVALRSPAGSLSHRFLARLGQVELVGLGLPRYQGPSVRRSRFLVPRVRGAAGFLACGYFWAPVLSISTHAA